jgi:hypothetical protein
VGNKIKCLKIIAGNKKKHLKIVGNKKIYKLWEKKLFFFKKKSEIAAIPIDAKCPEKRGKMLQLATVSNCRKNQQNRR